MTNLSRLQSVDLRIAWQNEAQDFTPWLADHLSELGEALGMDLELVEREAAVGGLSLDILATDTNLNRLVIIENQLESTDPHHLGRLLIYAAGYDAKVVVWLAKEFRDEHRQALDWLNRQTTESTEFFGVVVELWQIDDSAPAPHFKLVATPNDWSKSIRGGASIRRDTSEREEKYRVFFQSLIDTLRVRHQFTGARKGQPQSWSSFTSGFGGVTYGASFGSGNRARVEIYIDVGDAEKNLDLFQKLEEHKEPIESHFTQPLNWQPLESRRACRIHISRAGSIQDGEEALRDIQAWMVEHLLEFKEVFGPHLRNALRGT